MVSSEKWFVYEWSDESGEPSIIAWCKTRKEAEGELDSAVALAHRTLSFGKRRSVIGTEYALCHIEKEVEISEKEA